MAVDYFLKIDGIDGESQDSKHKNEIDILSWNWGATNSGHAAVLGGAGTGKVSVQDFHFTMLVNKSAPKLMQACASGEHHKTATLTCRKSGTEAQEYLKIKMTEVFVSSFQTGGSGSDSSLPTDQVSLNFAKVEYEYKEQKPDGTLGGSVKAGWDVAANKKI